VTRDDGGVRDVEITGDGIRLGQFLKLADVVEAGSDVKALLAGEVVLVNEEPETRRGRQLFPGDIIEVSGQLLRVIEEAR
jgi:ribosome-associated protein